MLPCNTADIQKSLVGHPEENQPVPPPGRMTVQLTADERIAVNKSKLPGAEDLQWTDAPVDLIRLKKWFQILINRDRNRTHTAVQEAKTAIAETFCRFVEKQAGGVPAGKQKQNLWKRGAFVVLSLFWIVRDSTSVVIGIRDILPAGLLRPLPFAIISAAASFITGSLLYFMELRFFKTAMEIGSEGWDTTIVLAHRQSMDCVSKMNIRLLEKSRTDLLPGDFGIVAGFAGLLNQDAGIIKKKYSRDPAESFLQSAAWWGVKICGIAIGCFSDYFIWYSLLYLISPAMVTAPLGIGLLIGTTVLSFMLYHFLYSRDFIRGLVPSIREYDVNKNIAKNMNVKSEKDFTERYNERCLFRCARQTHALKRSFSEPDLRNPRVTVRVDPRLFLGSFDAGKGTHPASAAPDPEADRWQLPGVP